MNLLHRPLSAPDALLPIIMLILFLLPACRTHDAREVQEAMDRYNRYVLRMDADSVSSMYTPDGELGNVKKGRDSIRIFLASFTKVTMDHYDSKTLSIAVDGNTAVLRGTYVQQVRLDGGEAISYAGEFTTRWVWTSAEGCRVQRMDVAPR
jgi:ketosteroid isomerase-like protein